MRGEFCRYQVRLRILQETDRSFRNDAAMTRLNPHPEPERRTLTPTALIIDDDQDLRDLLGKILETEGMQVYGAQGGLEGLSRMKSLKPDLIFLDIMMPGMNGWEVTERIRQVTDVPIIILSAMSRSKAVIRSLEAGADDFISKPFRKVELSARVQALLRRTIYATGPPIYSTEYDDGHLGVNLEEARIFLDGKQEYLSPTEYRLFEYLYLNAGRVCSAATLLEYVWGKSIPNDISYLHVYMWKLRNKIEPDPSTPRYILTEHGIGYRFVRHN